MRSINHITLFFALLACLNSAFAQKKMVLTEPAENLKGIFIESDQIFQIYVKATNSDQLVISTEVEGETFETLEIDTALQNDLLYITTGRSVGFKAFDDKLAAHKVLSVVLHIELPANKELWVNSSLASVEAQGAYSYVNLNLSGGRANLLDFTGNGVVNTLRGAIDVETRTTKIEASSRNGSLHVATSPVSLYKLTLKSVDGSISVTQSE